ncbi:MAG: GGDEF domain-containing protein [Lysobacterales bacterium]
MHSIKSKLVAFALLATLVPSVGLGLLSFWGYQTVLNDNVSHELRMLAADASGELKLWLRERVNELRTISAANTLSDGLSAGTEPRSGATRAGTRELELYLRSVQGKLDSILELTLSDAAGQLVASSAPTPAPIALPATWPNTVIDEGVVMRPPHWDRARATATLTVVVPVLSLRNELLGALTAILDLSTVKGRLQDVVKTSPAEVLVLAADGEPLLGTRSATTELTLIDIKELYRLRAQAGKSMMFNGHHRHEVIGVADMPHQLPVIVVAERERAEVFATWITLLKLFLLLVMGLTLLVGAIAYWMGRSIVTPLNRLIEATDDIARGNLDVRLPGDPAGEIGGLTRVFNMMAERLRRGHAEIEAARVALEEKNLQLEVLAVTDSLTGLYNRKKLDEILVDQFARFRRNHRPFALLMLDLDRFKSINDNYGHLAGDEVLTTVAARLKQSVRAVDFVARYGGEEFVVVLVETPLGEALEIAERIRAAVEVPGFNVGSATISITVSLGLTHSRESDDDPEKMLFRADDALYGAKRAGRNQVQCAI